MGNTKQIENEPAKKIIIPAHAVVTIEESPNGTEIYLLNGKQELVSESVEEANRCITAGSPLHASVKTTSFDVLS